MPTLETWMKFTRVDALTNIPDPPVLGTLYFCDQNPRGAVIAADLGNGLQVFGQLESHNKGWFGTEAGLIAGVDSPEVGDFAYVTETHSVWRWDGSWSNTDENGNVDSLSTPDGSTQTGEVTLTYDSFPQFKNSLTWEGITAP
jgi:hypothetical protein